MDTFKSSTTHITWSLLIPYPTGTSLLAPQRSPSISMVLIDLSISSMLVSSSQGLQSRRTEVLAISAGFLDFLAAYASNLSWRILAASSDSSSSSSEPKRSTSSSSSSAAAGAAPPDTYDAASFWLLGNCFLPPASKLAIWAYHLAAWG